MELLRAPRQMSFGSISTPSENKDVIIIFINFIMIIVFNIFRSHSYSSSIITVADNLIL